MSLKKLLLLMVLPLCALSALADVTVTGVVTSSEDNEPVIGATVAQKGKPSNGTATDIDGKFTITLPSYDTHIRITYVGMTEQEVKASNKEMHIVLEANSKVLGDVVVTGMQKVDGRTFTGAATKIDASKARLDGIADISRGLEGKVAGLTVQNVSSTFGTAPKIRVRGATSIYGSSKPLWIVDGVELADNVNLSSDDLSSGDATTLIASAIAGLNADDIESFQVLKDGSATSIYGAKAMAGVIVVTTKSGRKGHTSINYTGEFTTRLKPSYSEYNISNSQEQMGIYKEMENKGWLEFASLANGSSYGVYGRMYNLIDSYENGKFGLANTPAARNAYLREAEFRNTDWFDLLFNTNIVQNHAVSINGGTDKGSFYTSFSYMDDPGWYKDSKVSRYTFNANAIYNFSSKLSFKLLTSDSYRKQRAPGTLSQDVDVVNGQVKRSFDINPFSYALNTSRTLDPNISYRRNYTDFNIFQELDNNYIDINLSDLKFQGELNIKPVTGLDIHLLGSYRYNSATQNHFVKDNSNQANAYRAGVDPEDALIRSSNPYLYTDPDDENALPETVLPKGGFLYHRLNSVKQLDFRGTAQYMNTFGRKHTVNGMIGMESSKVDRTAEQFNGIGIVYANGNIPFTDYNYFKQQQEENGSYYSETYTYNRSLAYFATATYSFDARYALTGTVRYEGSNLMGKSHQSRWLPTWNVSGAWNMHEEPWFKEWKGNRKFSHAKIRASYSLTADAGPRGYANSAALYNPNKPWRMETSTQEIGLSLDGLANSELTYEKKHEVDLGADLGFFDNRLNLVFDWYDRDNYDLIGLVYTEGVGGFTRKYANVASMSSHGVEFTISTTNIQPSKPDGFRWTTDWTFSYTKTKITELRSRSRVIDLITSTGYPLQGYPYRAIFSIPFVGLNDQGLPQFINENGETTVSDINFQEYNKLNNLKYEGPVDPTVTGGFGNYFDWKGWHLGIFMTYSFGNKIRLDPVFSAAYSDLSALPKEFKNRWVVPGDEAVTDIPVIASRRQYYANTTLSRAYSAYNYSTARIASGSFIRMKEISLAYDLPQKFLKTLHLNSGSVKLATTNPFLIYSDSKLNGQDPEYMNSGGVASPIAKQFTFTLRLGL